MRGLHGHSSSWTPAAYEAEESLSDELSDDCWVDQAGGLWMSLVLFPGRECCSVPTRMRPSSATSLVEGSLGSWGATWGCGCIFLVFRGERGAGECVFLVYPLPQKLSKQPLVGS